MSSRRGQAKPMSNGHDDDGEEKDLPYCPMEAHISDLLGVRDSQTNQALLQKENSEKLVTSLQNVATQLESANENFSHFVSLMKLAFRMFGRAVLVFLVVVVALCLVIVYVARMDMDYKDFHIHPRRGMSAMARRQTYTAPNVDFPPSAAADEPSPK